MKPFEEKQKRPVFVIAAGRAGYAPALVSRLSAQGPVFVIADREGEPSASLYPHGYLVADDVTDLDILEKAGLEGADIAVAATDNDNANLLIAQLAKEIFGVGRIIAVLNDPSRACVYQELGVAAFSPADIFAEAMARELLAGKKDELP